MILGEVKLKDYLISLSEGLSLKTYVWDRDRIEDDFDVYFLGFQKNPFKFISRSSIFVFTSLWEGFPNALIEAMACGIPVVSSDCRSGPREILAPDTDFECEAKDPEFAQYGVLMPVFDGEFKGAGDPLSREEEIWVETLSKMLTHRDIIELYSREVLKRASQFHIQFIANQWRDLIEKVSL